MAMWVIWLSQDAPVRCAWFIRLSGNAFNLLCSSFSSWARERTRRIEIGAVINADAQTVYQFSTKPTRYARQRKAEEREYQRQCAWHVWNDARAVITKPPASHKQQ